MSRTNAIALIVFGVLLVWVFSLDAETTQNIQKKVLSLFSPFQRAGTEIQDSLEGVGESAPDPRKLLEENERLRNEVAELRIYRDDLVKLREEYNEITSLLGLKQMSHLSLISSRVIGHDSSHWWRTVTIDKGTNNGIAVESPVLNDQGLIGKTHLVDKAASMVLLLTDEQCQVSARIEGTNEKGLIQGIRGTPSGRQLLKLSTYSKRKVELGSRVFTSGAGGLFPPGILIGEVKNFRLLKNQGYGEATVEPAVDFSKLNFVFVMERERGVLAERGTSSDAAEVPN